ncbi:MAG: protocatechuate 3,4-dioxygenase subunit alpha [Actinomycetota bacterium]|nr:protocatechuate 3,4-dioxygenase subunit alpha [Actinomycetota bacterium]
MRGPTPSQTVGPFFSIALGGGGGETVAPDDDPDRIVIAGIVFDGDSRHVEDALLELWQADRTGRYRHPDDLMGSAFAGFGRAHTDYASGRYSFQTVKPGPVPSPGGEEQAPHISLIIQARGMLNPLFTRVYFSDETAANRRDVVLGLVPVDRRPTLIAELVETAVPPQYHFDVRLQGEGETVFFDF